jgi:hypothetical protein
MGHNVIFVVIAIMLVVGVIFAVIWWHLADVLFPGTAKKTGQKILPLGEDGSAKGPPPGAKVIRFDETPSASPKPPA